MRGTRRRTWTCPKRLGSIRRGGIIPAHAGNTRGPPFSHAPKWDHPRACGEHLSTVAVSDATTGSSPRMRGTQHTGTPFRRFSGIIPAHAGNTNPRRSPTRCRQDHPRACGEHPFTSCSAYMIEGSSPRMRGTPEEGGDDVRSSWIIPAHAGNTTARRSRDCEPVGSSPRMRGTRGYSDKQVRGAGIIPAHAGNTR